MAAWNRGQVPKRRPLVAANRTHGDAPLPAACPPRSPCTWSFTFVDNERSGNGEGFCSLKPVFSSSQAASLPALLQQCLLVVHHFPSTPNPRFRLSVGVVQRVRAVPAQPAHGQPARLQWQRRIFGKRRRVLLLLFGCNTLPDTFDLSTSGTVEIAEVVFGYAVSGLGLPCARGRAWL